jgi:uroporphyrinogen-III synthase
VPHNLPSLLLTRPDEASERLAVTVTQALGRPVPTVISPLIAITPLAPDLPPAEAVILTSANAARAAAGLGLPAGLPAWCVGEATAQAAAAAGLAPVSADGDAAALVALIASRASPGTRLLHLRGEESRGEVAARLTARGFPTEERIVYRQTAQPLTAAAVALLAGAAPVVVPLFSPRTARLFAATGPHAAPLIPIAISAAAAARVAGLGPVRIAPQPTGAAMLAEITAALEGAGLP